MLIYAADMVTGTHEDVIHSMIVKLQQQYPIKDLRPPTFFLGIQV